MIDTVKIYTHINEKIKNKIIKTANLKGSYHFDTGEIDYEILLNTIEMSYSNIISVRCNRYDVDGIILDVECSLHKVLYGQNAYNGFYNLIEITNILIKILENSYDIVLPVVNDWYVQRIDVARVFDLENQKNIKDYLYKLSFLTYPKRKTKYYENESIYVNGSTTTLKIYNKLVEFIKHDKRKLNKTNFNMFYFENKIQGYIRYEVELKKRFLKEFYKKEKIKVIDVKYEDLLKVWEMEFKMLYKFSKDNVISDKIKINNRLISMYGCTKGNRLYSFYLQLVCDGERKTKQNFDIKNSIRTFYRNLKDIKDAGIDYSQQYKIQKLSENELIDFNPFMPTNREVS